MSRLPVSFDRTSEQTGVYFVCADYPGQPSWVKIGYCVDMKTRFEMLQTANPFYLVLLGFIEEKDENWREPGHLCRWEVEKMLHQMFSHLRGRGEWFELTHELLTFIRDNTTQVHPSVMGRIGDTPEITLRPNRLKDHYELLLSASQKINLLETPVSAPIRCY